MLVYQRVVTLVLNTAFVGLLLEIRLPRRMNHVPRAAASRAGTDGRGLVLGLIIGVDPSKNNSFITLAELWKMMIIHWNRNWGIPLSTNKETNLGELGELGELVT
jgi:hypothetical protein